jgi:hypothetical protein
MKSKVAGFYAARSRPIPPLPWQTIAPPFSIHSYKSFLVPRSASHVSFSGNVEASRFTCSQNDKEARMKFSIREDDLSVQYSLASDPHFWVRVARQPSCPLATTTLAGFETAGVGVSFGVFA